MIVAKVWTRGIRDLDLIRFEVRMLVVLRGLKPFEKILPENFSVFLPTHGSIWNKTLPAFYIELMIGPSPLLLGLDSGIRHQIAGALGKFTREHFPSAQVSVMVYRPTQNIVSWHSWLDVT